MEAQQQIVLLPPDAYKEVNENLIFEEMDKILGNFQSDQPDQQQNTSNHEEQVDDEEKEEKVQTGEEQEEEDEEYDEEEGNNVNGQITLDDVVVGKEKIVFGYLPLFPGTIQEVDFSVNINFKDNEQNSEVSEKTRPYILRILAVCKNEEFDSLDEYVFSVRSNNYYEYYEEVRFKIRRGERADVKVAVKIPPVKQNYHIHGLIQVRVENLEPIHIPITAKCIIPQIISLKTLYNEKEGTSIIKVPAKKGQLRTPPLPFKNLSSLNLGIEVEAIGVQDYSQKPYDIVVQNFVNCQANSLFYVNMQLKENSNWHEQYPSRMTIRKILLLRVKNSSSIFHFPLEVNVFEGQIIEGN